VQEIMKVLGFFLDGSVHRIKHDLLRALFMAVCRPQGNQICRSIP
jgi:hypothetical protein